MLLFASLLQGFFAVGNLHGTRGILILFSLVFHVVQFSSNPMAVLHFIFLTRRQIPSVVE